MTGSVLCNSAARAAARREAAVGRVPLVLLLDLLDNDKDDDDVGNAYGFGFVWFGWFGFVVGAGRLVARDGRW